MVWSKIKEVKTINNEILLTGFANFGSVGFVDAIKFNKIKVKTEFKLLKDIQEKSAILDLDFDSDNTTFASVVYDSGTVGFEVKDMCVGQNISKNSTPLDFNWHILEIKVEDQKVYFYLDNNFLGEYSYQYKLEYVKAYFGNNFINDFLSISNKIGLMIKNSSITIDNEDFPLITDNLI